MRIPTVTHCFAFFATRFLAGSQFNVSHAGDKGFYDSGSSIKFVDMHHSAEYVFCDLKFQNLKWDVANTQDAHVTELSF